MTKPNKWALRPWITSLPPALQDDEWREHQRDLAARESNGADAGRARLASLMNAEHARRTGDTLTERQDKGREKRAAAADAESARRKRQWLTLRRQVASAREWASLPERRWNAEADRLLAAWLTERGTKASARTIANQRTREGWIDGG